MRISDWSSDVCFSDLDAHHVLVSVVEAGNGEPAGEVDAGRPRAGEPCDLGGAAGGQHPAAERRHGLGEAEPRELGRASCRDRVCQAVSISVVGVTLKKKKSMESNITRGKTNSH